MPSGRNPQAITMSSTPWRASQSIMYRRNGRSTSGMTGFGKRQRDRPQAGAVPTDQDQRLQFVSSSTADMESGFYTVTRSRGPAAHPESAQRPMPS